MYAAIDTGEAKIMPDRDRPRSLFPQECIETFHEFLTGLDGMQLLGKVHSVDHSTVGRRHGDDEVNGENSRHTHLSSSLSTRGSERTQTSPEDALAGVSTR